MQHTGPKPPAAGSEDIPCSNGQCCRSDLDKLKLATGVQQHELSSTDLLAGLVWTLNCLAAESPLPGEASTMSFCQPISSVSPTPPGLFTDACTDAEIGHADGEGFAQRSCHQGPVV